MSKKRMTRKNAGEVLWNTIALIVMNKDVGTALVARINAMLDECLEDDLLGTEGQLDPRGDRRDDE
jgi:hypothetical protein